MTIEGVIEEHRALTPESEKEEFEQRLKPPYNGYTGMLPKHMTNEQKCTFFTEREMLFGKTRLHIVNFKNTEIIEAINSWVEHYNKKSQPMMVPDKISKHIQELGWLKYQSLLSKKELLNKTLGEGAKRAFISIYNDNPFLEMDGLDWNEVTMCVTENLHALIQARGKKRLVSYTDLGFISKNRNKETAIFKEIKASLDEGLDLFCSTRHNKMKVSRLRGVLQKYTGIITDPFKIIGEPGNSSYKARFKITTPLPKDNIYTSDSYLE